MIALSLTVCTHSLIISLHDVYNFSMIGVIILNFFQVVAIELIVKYYYYV
jgi:hypothetical protein